MLRLINLIICEATKSAAEKTQKAASESASSKFAFQFIADRNDSAGIRHHRTNPETTGASAGA